MNLQNKIQLPQDMFRDILYLDTDNQTIYNATADRIVKPQKDNCFTLVKPNGVYCRLALKTIYKLVNLKCCEDNTKDLDSEIWREVKNTNGDYLVSNLGRIKSLKGYKARILKPSISKSGYQKVDINRVTLFVHRLVADAFITPPPSINDVLHHIDKNKLNNRADNLKWVSRTEHSRLHKGSEKNV